MSIVASPDVREGFSSVKHDVAVCRCTTLFRLQELTVPAARACCRVSQNLHDGAAHDD